MFAQALWSEPLAHSIASHVVEEFDFVGEEHPWIVLTAPFCILEKALRTPSISLECLERTIRSVMRKT